MKFKRHLTGVEIYCAIAEWLIRRGHMPDTSRPSMTTSVEPGSTDMERGFSAVIEVEVCTPREDRIDPTPKESLPEPK